VTWTHTTMANTDMLTVLPGELVGRVFRFLTVPECERFRTVSKAMQAVFEFGMKEWLIELITELRQGLKGDVTIYLREPYMGGAQPVDGDMVSISPVMCTWKLKEGEEFESLPAVVWSDMVNAVATSMFPKMLFVSVTLDDMYYKCSMNEWALKLPDALQTRVDVFASGMAKVVVACT
jgi:hypothetical protein